MAARGAISYGYAPPSFAVDLLMHCNYKFVLNCGGIRSITANNLLLFETGESNDRRLVSAATRSQVVTNLRDSYLLLSLFFMYVPSESADYCRNDGHQQSDCSLFRWGGRDGVWSGDSRVTEIFIGRDALIVKGKFVHD